MWLTVKLSYKAEYFFILLKVLFKKTVPHFKKKYSKKTIKVWSYFEDFGARNIVVQSDFDLDIWFLKI
jgi:hypothetical protein